MADDEEISPVVIDNGSSWIRAGKAGDDAPSLVFPNVVGWPKDSTTGDEFYIGDEAQSRREALSLRYPMNRGIVTNWDDMERVWSYVYSKLGVSSETQPTLLSEPPLNPKANREKMCQVMFEQFHVPQFYVALQGVLDHYCYGRVISLNLEMGDGVTQVIPVYEGYVVTEGIRRVDFGGSDVTSYLSELLKEKGYNFSTPAQRELVCKIKEAVCYVAEDFDQENMAPASSVEKDFELPDGNVITVGSERFRAAECLFRPELAGRETVKGIHKLVMDSLMDCAIDTRMNLFYNILLSGGATLIPGIQERMKKEIDAMVPPSMMRKVHAKPERKYAVWIGGSIIASLYTFNERWVTRAEYEEHGPTIVHRKCFS